MNVNKIKEFIDMRKELNGMGVIGVNLHADEVQVKSEVLATMDNLQFHDYGTDEYEYRYEIFTHVDGIKIFTVCTGEELETLFPQFKGYLVEDVDLSGMKEVI
jgi:hypothetical protein